MKKIIVSCCFVLITVSGIKAQFYIDTVEPSCTGTCNGSAQVYPTGAYTYLWSTGATTQGVSNLCVATYWCKVYSSGLLVDSLSWTFQQHFQIAWGGNGANGFPCYGGYFSSLNALPINGTPPYTYVWSTGDTGKTVQGPLPANATYGITATDNTGCVATESGHPLIDTTPITITDSVVLPTSCTACNGQPNINATGGTLPDVTSFAWSNGSTSLTPLLCPGVYTFSLTDLNLCAVSKNIIVNSNGGDSVVLAHTNISCFHYIDTTTVTVFNGSGSLNFDWGDSTTSTGVSSPQTHYYTAGGVYIIKITDGNCSYFLVDSVLDSSLQLGYSQANLPSCTHPTQGFLLLSLTNGTPPYTYAWNNGATSDSLVNVTAGDYSVTVTDNTGCTATQLYTFQQTNDEAGYYIYLQPGETNCSGTNGSVAALITGGTSPFNYRWSNNAQSSTINNLTPGNYSITVTDAIGCKTMGNVLLYSSCYNTVAGVIFNDANENCIQDAGEAGLPGIVVEATGNNGTFYANSDSNGYYNVQIPDSGTYNLILDLNQWSCGSGTLCGNITQTVTFTGFGDSSVNNNFAFQSGGLFDLALHPGWTTANPGFTKEYWVMGFNQGIEPFSGTATIIFTYDSNLIYQSSYTPLPIADTAAHTLTWTVNNLPSPNYDWNSRFRNFFLVPATLSPSYQLQSSFSITPTDGDCDTTNNYLSFSDPVTGSHDPNEKVASPANNISPDDSVITYTIHFQNTGTDTTHFVVVKDTLSPYLNPGTVKNIASSAAYSDFTISGKGILTWTFNPLFLPDTFSNVASSKGFITFTVQKIKNLPLGTSISNSASIYFDYNTPVVTNTVADTITVSGIAEISGNNGVSVRAYPNPFSDATNIVVTGINEKFGFELYDVTGRLQINLPTVTSNQFQIQRGGLAGGIYWYRIVAGNRQVAFGKLVVE